MSFVVVDAEVVFYFILLLCFLSCLIVLIQFSDFYFYFIQTIPSTRSQGNINNFPESFTVGDGFWATGKLVEVRNHTFQNDKKYNRFVALVCFKNLIVFFIMKLLKILNIKVIDIDEAAKRTFLNGVEQEKVC